MTIMWHGISCFEIRYSHISKGEVGLVINPYQNSTGLRFPRTLEADIVTVSHTDDSANNLEAVLGEPFVIKVPGEYEVKDVFVHAVETPLHGKSGKESHHRVCHFDIEGIHLAHLGGLNRDLTDDEYEQLDTVDILMIPVGGGSVISPKLAADMIAKIEPRVVLPMTYAIDGIKEKLEPLSVFCKQLGSCQMEEATKYKVTQKTLPEDTMLLMELKR